MQDITSAIVSSCAHFFSVMLPSSSLLILDFIKATDGIIISQNVEVISVFVSVVKYYIFCTTEDLPFSAAFSYPKKKLRSRSSRSLAALQNL